MLLPLVSCPGCALSPSHHSAPAAELSEQRQVSLRSLSRPLLVGSSVRWSSPLRVTSAGHSAASLNSTKHPNARLRRELRGTGKHISKAAERPNPSRSPVTPSMTSPPTSAWKAFDLQRNYSFYGAYHANSVNKGIHILCVWPILFSALLLLQYLPPLLSWPLLPMPWGGALSVNAALLVALGYSTFYLILEPKAGAVAALLVAFCFVGSHAVLHSLGSNLAWKVGVAMQVFCWVAQFLGHGVYEGRAPALLDNLAQAFLMAPFFVLLEVLHTLFNFEPEVGFWEIVEKDISAEISAFKSQSKKD